MLDSVTIMLIALSFITAIAAAEYYRRLKLARIEYLKARAAVEEIVLSFNRDLRREAQQLEWVAYKVEEISAIEGKASARCESLENVVHTLQSQKASNEDLRAMSRRGDEFDRNISKITESNEILRQKLTALEQEVKQPAQTQVETSNVGLLPVRRDRAIGRLTETEIAALEFLASNGSRTAPEIKEQVRLSREHTARLMKKLYEEGYLERDTNKIPFRYSVKKEMEKLLKKPENEASTST